MGCNLPEMENNLVPRAYRHSENRRGVGPGDEVEMEKACRKYQNK